MKPRNVRFYIFILLMRMETLVMAAVATGLCFLFVCFLNPCFPHSSSLIFAQPNTGYITPLIKFGLGKRQKVTVTSCRPVLYFYWRQKCSCSALRPPTYSLRNPSQWVALCISASETCNPCLYQHRSRLSCICTSVFFRTHFAEFACSYIWLL